MDLKLLDYITTINGLKQSDGFEKDCEILDMVDDYEVAKDEVITRFDVIVNTSDGKDIYINNSSKAIRGVVITKKKQGATSSKEDYIQTRPNLIKRGDYLKFRYNENDILHDYIITSDI